MTKGTLRINATKKGREFKAVYRNNKDKEVEFVIYSTAMGFDPDKAKDGDPVELECAPNGVIVRCVIPGKEAAPKPRTDRPANKNDSNRSTHSGGGSYQQTTRRGSYGSENKQPQGGGSQADAAPLANATAPYNFIPFEPSAVLPYVEPDEEPGQRWSGVLRVSLRALTPLLVAGLQATAGNGPARKTFFKVNGRHVIPGSSLKGMLRSLAEVLSFSNMRPMNTKNIFWRNISSPGYRKQFLGANDAILGGYLVKKGAQYFLTRVEVTPSFFGAPASSEREIVKTGNMPGKKRDYLFARSDKPGAPVPEKVIDDFFDQRTPAQLTKWKNEGYDQKIHNPGIPVFFKNDSDGTISALGLCRYFRLKYAGKPIDFAPDQGLDLVQALFGATRNQGRKGRVAVGAATVEGQPDREYATVLGQPHPTCLAHYLEQKAVQRSPYGNCGNKLESFSSYQNREFRLRGRKWYWHRDVDIPPPPNKNAKVQSTLQPLQAGATATFDIRLDRVSSLELGALLEALELPDGHAHKLGLGKPLGFGSVLITLERADVRRVGDRYASLGARLEGHGAALDANTRGELRAAFRAEILRRVSGQHPQWKDVKSYDDLPPIKALRIMMDFKNKPDNANTKYMDLDKFKLRPILPVPEGICQR